MLDSFISSELFSLEVLKNSSLIDPVLLQPGGNESARGRPALFLAVDSYWTHFLPPTPHPNTPPQHLSLYHVSNYSLSSFFFRLSLRVKGLGPVMLTIPNSSTMFSISLPIPSKDIVTFSLSGSLAVILETIKPRKLRENKINSVSYNM
jgi:hypothetical protein